MPPRRTGQSSSLAPDLEFDTPSPLDDSVSTLRTSARVLLDIAGVLTKFPFVKPLAAVIVVMCEIFEASALCTPDFRYFCLWQVVECEIQ
jgi:hypothetical protein